DESGIKLIPREKEELDKAQTAHDYELKASTSEAAAGAAHLIPTTETKAMPFGVGVSMVVFGGTLLGNALSAAGKVFQIISSQYSHEASMASKAASYIRREQEWALLANNAAKEVIQLDKQITSADIQIQIAQTDLANHNNQIERSKAVETFLNEKFTKLEQC